jgi:hypothetical protein
MEQRSFKTCSNVTLSDVGASALYKYDVCGQPGLKTKQSMVSYVEGNWIVHVKWGMLCLGKGQVGCQRSEGDRRWCKSIQVSKDQKGISEGIGMWEGA